MVKNQYNKTYQNTMNHYKITETDRGITKIIILETVLFANQFSHCSIR